MRVARVMLFSVALGAIGSASLGMTAGASRTPTPNLHLFTVSSPTMSPTLLGGDAIAVDEQPSDFLPLRTGEIVVLKPPIAEMVCGLETGDILERVIGLPKETIQSRGNTVYIDGKRLAESWLPTGQPLGKSIPLEKIRAGRYYVMADNRPISCDSRVWGTIGAANVVGQVTLSCPPNSSKRCRAFT